MEFKDFFGMSSSEIKKICIICQNYDLPLFSQESKNGFFVKTADAGNATAIALKNNFLAGDAVLKLKDSGCENILLFGSCGGCGEVESGDILFIDKTYNLESFSKMLKLEEEMESAPFSESLNSAFYGKYPYEDLIKTNSACVSSLILETLYTSRFKDNGICAIDMESSIVLSAANKIGAQAACFMYVADHIEKNPVGIELEKKQKNKISLSRKKLAKMIMDFTNDF